jgi:ThiF family
MKTPAAKTAPVKIDAELFARVTDAYDLKLLAQSRQVRIGIGSSTKSLEDSARAGVGQFVLIDNGRVERCNLATQAYYAADVGKPKVEVMARRLRAINPAVAIFSVFRPLQDVSDTFFEVLALAAFGATRHSTEAAKPVQTILVGATDDFFCQSRVNILALNYGLPSICCQHYEQGFASELTFTHPKTVRACHRCILSSRYDAYLNQGFKNPVGSAGSPISSAAMLNALTNNLELAILHHGTNHPRWGDLLARIGDRNLIQIRCHPEAENRLGLKNFSQAFSGANPEQFLFGETIWRRQLPEHPDTGYSRPCPDCGGTGNLSSRIGAFADTRIINP